MLRVGKSEISESENLEIVKFIAALWSHHQYKQCKQRPFLGISILYTVEICLIVPFHRWKRWSETNIACAILWSHSYHNNMITKVNRMWRKFRLPKSSHGLVIFSLISRCIPILSLLLPAFWVFDSHGTANTRHIHVIGIPYIYNNPCLFYLLK